MRKIIFVFIIFLPIIAFSKSYFYPEIRTEMYFTIDGDIHVLQQRTYTFNGSYSWAFVNLKKRGARDIIVNRISEKTYNGWQTIEPEIINNPTSLYIRWNYSANNESKTFLLDYTILDAVKRFNDVAEFYWKFIEDEHERINEIKLELFLPESSSKLFKVYIHSLAKPGTLTYNVRLDRALIEQKGIPENSFVEVRMLTEPSIFPNVSLQSQSRYQQILNEEKRNFLMSSLRKFVLFPIGLAIMIIIPIILLLIYYNRYGREPQIPYIGEYEHEPPRKAPPVFVPAILSQKLDKNEICRATFRGMFASILDLTTKGLVSIQEIKNHKTHYQFNLEKRDKLTDLEPINQEVANFFFEDKNMVTDKELKENAQRHPSEFRSTLTDFYNQGLNWWKTTLGAELLDPRSTKAYNRFILYIFITIAIGAALAGTGFGVLVGAPAPAGFVIPIIFGMMTFIILLFVGRIILRWSPEAYLEQKRWHNFKRFLTDFSQIKDAPVILLAIWEQYFVYAVALGVAQKFLKNLTIFAAQQNRSVILPVWYLSTAKPGAMGVSSFAESMSNFESFANNFSSMMNSFSTSAATGGGFSGGGGGSGGGGSSGAG